jgi:hypothetical protein
VSGDTRHLAREERLARLKAQRAGWEPRPERTIQLADLQVGDYLERIPSQGGARGLVVQATVTAIDEAWDEWVQRTPGRGRNTPVASRRLSFADQRLVGVSAPAEFQVVVR